MAAGRRRMVRRAPAETALRHRCAAIGRDIATASDAHIRNIADCSSVHGSHACTQSAHAAHGERVAVVVGISRHGSVVEVEGMGPAGLRMVGILGSTPEPGSFSEISEQLAACRHCREA